VETREIREDAENRIPGEGIREKDRGVRNRRTGCGAVAEMELSSMNVTKAFMLSALLGLAACANHSEPQIPDGLAKNGSTKVEASNEVDEDAF
jgi:hypothetical protein